MREQIGGRLAQQRGGVRARFRQRARQVEGGANRRFVVYADGDPIAELPATFTIARRALRLIAPVADADGSRAPEGGRLVPIPGSRLVFLVAHFNPPSCLVAVRLRTTTFQ